MSNKTLFFAICAVMLLVVGVGVYKINTQTTTSENQDLKSQNNTANPTQQNLEKNNLNEKISMTPTPIKLENKQGACNINFDPEKLKNEKVVIKDRKVEITVKDFGKIELEFYDKDAPKTVENFLRLTNAGYYDCITFHRVSKGFVVQAGDPTGTGAGGQSAFGQEFADELNINTDSYKAGYKHGVLAMANRGPNTNTSQFFIMLKDNLELPKNYTIFGKVVKGLDVVDKIGQVEVTPGMFGPTDGKPKIDVVMESVKIIK